MESLSIWSLAGVVLSSRPYSSKYTKGVAHINYDVTVSNGVNLCHPLPVAVAGYKYQL